MNYNSLFNLIYSTEISEATKDSIIDRIDFPINESKKHVVFKQDLENAQIRKLKKENPDRMYIEDEYLDIDGSQAEKRKRMEAQINKSEALVETYIDLLDTLVLSTASEALIYNIIDEVFSSVDEAIINEVSDEWVKRKTEAGLKSRKETLDKANKSVKSGVIGLSQLRNQEKAQQRYNKGVQQAAARAPKTEAPEKTSKLKSVVGKVKNWADKVSPFDKGVQHVGLARLIGAKANKEGIGAEDLRQRTTHKTSTTNVGASTPKANSSSTRSSRIEAARKKAQGTHIESGETINMGNSRIDRINKAKERAKGKHEESGETIPMSNAQIDKVNKAKEREKGAHIESGDTIELGAQRVKNGKEKAAANGGETKTTRGRKKKTETEAPVQQKLDLEASKPTNTEVKSEVKADDATKAAKEAPKAKETKEAKAAKANKAGGKKEMQSEITVSPQDKADAARYAEERHKSGNIGKRALEVKQAREERKAKEAAKKAEEEKAKQAAEAAKKAEEKKQSNSAKAKVEKVEQPKVEAAKPKEENKEQKPQKSALERLMARSKRDAEARDKDIDNSIRIKQERIDKIKASPDGQSKESQEEIKKIEASIAALKKQHSGTKVHEALSDLAVLLAHTNISEDCFVDVMKSVASSTPEAIRARNFEEIFNSKFNKNK